MRTRRSLFAIIAAIVPALAHADGAPSDVVDHAAPAPRTRRPPSLASEVRVTPSESGRIGTWLIAGPFRSATFAERKKPPAPLALNQAPETVDQAGVTPSAGKLIDGSTPPAGPPPLSRTATKKYVPPTKEEVAPFLNFAPLENGIAAYERAAQRYKSAFSKLAGANPTVWDSPELKAINQQLMQTERTFMTTEGLKERPWFKHQIYAPGAYTGYGVKTIPAVREMMEEDKWVDADAGSVIAGAVLLKQAALVDSMAVELESWSESKPLRVGFWGNRKARTRPS